MSLPSDADNKRLEVQEQQKPIAAWMRLVMERTGLNPTRWAGNAGLGRDTVSRAIKDTYNHITSTNTLIKLARAAGVPAPLHLVPTPAHVPSDAVLAAIFDELLQRLVPERQFPPELAEAAGRALRQTLLELAEDQDHGPERARMAARISARQQLRTDNSASTPEND